MRNCEQIIAQPFDTSACGYKYALNDTVTRFLPFRRFLMILYKHEHSDRRDLWSAMPLPHPFRRQHGFLSSTGWFAILALGAVVTGASLAFAS
jgi:hypothetical protein